jgi:hypothetical protein
MNYSKKGMEGRTRRVSVEPVLVPLKSAPLLRDPACKHHTQEKAGSLRDDR